LEGVGEILDLLSYGDSCNRGSNDIRSGLAADFRARVLTNVGNAGEPGKFNATVECKFGGTDISVSILMQENKKIHDYRLTALSF
jgi:hypothetical protein